MSLSKHSQLGLLLFFLLAGLFSRFYALEKWSFANDELFVKIELETLFGTSYQGLEPYESRNISVDSVSNYSRLPKINCLFYAIEWVGFRLWGTDEFGARFFPALFGALGIPLLFWLGRSEFGTVFGFTLAMFVLCWPEYLFQSQQSRFYAQPFFFSILTFFLARFAVSKNSLTAASLSGLSAVAMVLSHAITGVLWGVVLGALLCSAIAEKKFPPLRITLVFLIGSIVLLGIAFFHIRPLAQGWNSEQVWGYDSVHALLALCNALGWTSSIFCLLGLILALTRFRAPGVAYWTFCGVGTGVLILLLPKVIVFQPNYLFVLTLPFLILIALFIETVYQHLAKNGTVLASAWIFFACLVNLPSLASYYMDGARPNLKEAYHFVADHWKEGDRLAAFTAGTAAWYDPQCVPAIPLSMSNPVAGLEKIVQNDIGGNGRLWIVLNSHRGGLDLDLRKWVGEHCTYEARIGKKRLDYAEYTVEVFLLRDTTTLPDL